MNKLVSVCIPAYNNQDTIERTLSSIQSQTYQNLEIIVRDDCSTDNTASLVKKVISAVPRFRFFINGKNLGVVRNWNQCLSDARGEYICIFHGDDIYDQRIVSTQVRLLEQQSDVGVVFTSGFFIGPEGKLIGRSSIPDGLPVKAAYALDDLLPSILSFGNFLICSSAMVRKQIYKELGVYDERYVLGEDLDMWLRIISNGWLIGMTHEPLIKYRQSERQLSSRYHDNRIELSEHFTILDDFLASDRHRLDISARTKRQYLNRKSRDLLKCASHALNLNGIEKAKKLVIRSLTFQRRPKLMLFSVAVLITINLKKIKIARSILSRIFVTSS